MSDLGRSRLSSEQFALYRGMVADLRRGVVPDGVELEVVQSFMQKPFQSGFLQWGRCIVFCAKLQSFWLRVTFQHPEEAVRLFRLAEVGKLVYPAGQTSRVTTLSRVEQFVCTSDREEMQLLLQGVCAFPKGVAPPKLPPGIMSMDAYRYSARMMTECHLEALETQRERESREDGQTGSSS